MFSRLRSTSLGGLIDLASPRTEPDSPHQNASPGIPPSRQPSLNVHLSTSHRRHPPHSPQATRALDNSKREFTEVIESLQQVRPTDLSQTRALLSLMVAILQDTPDCRECMRENSGFLTLITVLASLEPHILTDSPKSLPLATALSTVPDLSISNHVKLPSIEIEESLSPTLGPARGSASSFPQFQGAHPVITPAEEEQDAVVVLVFRCLALALSNHCENQRFFSTTVGYKLVLDALRLSNLMPRPSSGKSTDSASTRNRRLKAEKLFGVLFAFIVSDFSCTNIFTAVRASVMAQSSENVPNQIPREPEPEDGTSLPAKNSGNHPHQPARPPSSIFKFDCDTKFENMSQLLRQSICDRAVPLRVEIADAVLLFLSLHADLFLSTTPDSDHLEADYELYFLGLKAIEILASTSRRSQICLNSTELTAVLLERLIPFSNAAPIVSTLPAKPNDKESTTQVIPSAGLEPWPSKSLAALFQNRKTINKIGARQCRKSARAIITRMLEVGSSPREARMLFRKSVVAPEASSNGTETLDDDYLEFILSGMQGSCCPPFIHFGSSPDRCAYAVLESLGPNPFPPIQGNGWTFASWLQIESFGTEGRPLELLTICDPTLSCFVRITISNSSHVIVQTAHQDQTSSTSTEPSDCSEAAKTAKVHGHPTGPSRATKDVKTSVEFVGFTFEHNRFYHFAIVQRPETKTSASTISLFIDGESIDTLEVMWPNPPQMQPVSAYFGHLSAPSNQSLTFVHERTDVPIPEHSQAGNSPLPQRRHAATHDRPRWNLGGCWLFHQDLSDQMLFVQSTLGPKIFTCFQDALGSFQTYTSSTLLNLKIDQLHHQAAQDSKSAANAAQAKPGSRRSPSSGVSKAVNSLNKSPLIKAIKEPASAFIPHHSIYFALSAKNGIVIGARRQDEKEPISSPVRSVSGLRHPYVSNESLYHMQQVYTPIDSYFFNRDALNKVATTSGPTSSAFGPSFANGILNAGIPNSKASHYPPDIASSPTRPLHPLSASLSSSSAPIRSASSDQVLQLFGDVTLCSPKGMDDSVWKMSGSIFLIRLVELASTEKQLATTLKIFFEATSHNWRLSEDAEKIQAYETLALVLRSKTRLFTPSIHRILLRFAGIIVDSASTESPPSQQSNASFPTELSSHSSPVLSDHIAGPKIIEQPSDYGLRESVITNPLAFRFLLLDFDLWSGPSYEIQCKHFESLCGMIETSVWSRFSMKRISKMNLLPKMLHSLRIQQFSNTSENPIQNNGDQTVISVFIKLLGCVLRAQFNSQAIRHLASYLTASLAPHQAVKRVPPSSQTKSPLSETFFPPDVAANKHQSGQVLSAGLNVPTSYIKPFCTSTTLDEPLMVLRVFHDLLLSSNEQESRHYIGRFLKAINGSKWLLMFFRADAHPDVILYSLRILTRLAQTQDIGWLQHFKNTLAGFAILRSVLTKFCFESNSVFVTALSMLSQVDIRTVPIFCSAAAGAPGAAPQVTTDDFRTVVRSIRGAPNELVTPEILPIVIALLKPSYVTRSREDKMTPVYAMEWLNLRMESPDDGWNEILGEKEIVKAWANYVTLLDCLPYQEGLYPINQATPSEAASDISHSTTHASCLSSFPLNVTCRCSAGSEDVTEILTGVHTNCPSPTQYVSLSSPKPQWPPSFSPSAGLGKRRKSRFASNATGIDPMLRITIPQSITINGEAVPATPSSCDAGSPRIISASTPCHMDKLLNESRVQPVSVSLYSYDDAREDIVQQMADISKRFLINFLFEHSPSTAITKKTSDETGTTANKTLRLGRAEQLLGLVVDRAGIDRAWITPFINQLIEVIVEETDPNSVPLAWLLTALQDGYLSGWLQPNSKAVSDLVMFIPSRTWKDSTPLLGDLLLIVLANRHTSSPELLLEQMRSRRLAEMIAIFPADVLQRMVYILTQYLSDTVNLRPVACDVLKLIFSYHPSVLEEFCLDIDLAKPVISSPPPLSPSSKDSNVVSCTTNESMSQNERDLAKVLQTGPDELKEVLEKSPSINLAGKLDWVQFLTESEVKASRTKVECRTKSKVTWTEYMNKVTIENRRLEVVLKKMESWARSVCEIDAARFANLRQDNLDNKNYLEIQLSKRVGELYRPYSILAKALDTTAFYWALDSTEGPSRQRRKLRRLPLKLDTRVVQQPKSRHHRMRSLGASRRDSYNAGDASGDDKRRSEYQSPTSPMGNEPMLQQDDIWTAEPEDEDDGGPEISLTRESKVVKVDVAKPKSVTVQQRNGEESGLDDFSEDKCRRILKSLEVNDVIQDAWNIEQVIGLDTCPALFLMAKNNIYIIDGFFQRPNGDIVNSWDAWEERDPHLQTLANLSRQTAKLNSRAAAHQSRRWAYSDIVSMSPRKWLFRDICIEFLFADGRSRLLTFSGTKRDAALKRLRECIRKSVGSEILFNMNVTLKSQTELWQNGQLSNHAYLLYLNDAAGRTYRDLTQHPVFPWILADYTSSELDLEKPESFRKLDLPMGAQSEARKRDFIERYASLEEFGAIGDERMKPAHYMTHYSSAVVVCGFLIRLQPFCDYFIEIQGSFDHADRTFWSIHRAWLSASEQSRSDVRELTPEFFHCSEFLLNLNKLSLGSRQEGGDPIGDVKLPPWAHGDSRLFVELHREALESDFVSEHIHHWIDLIFGYKQRGPAALDAVNVFQEVSYEGTVSLDAIDDDRERSSVLGAMCNWGLTPSQIFQSPHPTRFRQAKHAFEAKSTITASTCSALIQSVVPIRDIQQPIGEIYPARVLEKTNVSGPQSLLVLPSGNHRLDWGFLDQTLRIFDSSNALCGTFEGVSSEHISSACFADHRTLATGSTDSTISLWRFAWLSNGGAHLQQVEVLRGHSAPITCVVASRTLSIIVSGAEDGLAMVWDLNRALLVHSLPHPGPVSLAAISEGTGDIATCFQNTVKVWSINGDLLSTLVTSQYSTDAITACCWSRAEVKPLLVTGHRGGRLMFWQRKSVHAENPAEPWKMELIRTAQHEFGHDPRPSEVCALAMTDKAVLTGDTLGRLFCWALPGSACHLPDSVSSFCMLCDHKFGILEGRKRCISCSAIICSSCQDAVPGLNGRCCHTCSIQLMKLVV